MIDYREQVALALRAAGVSSTGSYSWYGRRSRVHPVGVRTPEPNGATRAQLVRELQGVLYRSFYTQGRPVPVSRLAGAGSRADPAFVDALSRSNSGRGGWQSGWRVERVGPRSLVVVAPDGLRVRVGAAECRPEGGRAVAVRRPREHRYMSPGFYTAFGDAVPSVAADDVEVRVYFNITASGAAPVVACCTDLLNRAGVPFVLKVLDNPAGFTRCDAAVLYVREQDFDHARGPLRAIVVVCATYLRAHVPAFTKPLADGVAVGEHRGDLGASFGSCRCRLVAEAIVDAHERRSTGLADRLEAVARRFTGIGLDLRVPYLVPRSVDRYVL
jgi:HopA1 effector protein family